MKLENLLLDPNDVLKISDFGLSVLRKEYHNHRELMAIAGTPNYIAPEVNSLPPLFMPAADYIKIEAFQRFVGLQTSIPFKKR